MTQTKTTSVNSKAITLLYHATSVGKITATTGTHPVGGSTGHKLQKPLSGE